MRAPSPSPPWVHGCIAVVDDVKFLSALIHKLESQYKIDAGRVYATGMSNGGVMSGRLACDLTDQIAAVAIVAASLSNNPTAARKPAKPVSVLIIQGTEDPLVRFQGGALGKKGDRGEVLSHDAAVKRFAALNRCPTLPQHPALKASVNDETSIQVGVYEGCAAGAAVEGITVERGGYTWPSGRQYLPASVIGKTTQNLASDFIWNFLAADPR